MTNSNLISPSLHRFSPELRGQGLKGKRHTRRKRAFTTLHDNRLPTQIPPPIYVELLPHKREQ